MMSSATDERKGERRWLGLVLMFIAAASFAGMAAFVKALRVAGMSTVETVVWRMAPGLPVLWLVLRIRREPAWRPHRPLLTGLRSFFGGLAMAGSFYAVGALTLVQHTVLHLTQPAFVALLAPGILGERLRGMAILSLWLALSGALLALGLDDALVRSLSTIPWIAGLAGLSAALMSALAHVTIRMATGKVVPGSLGALGRGLIGVGPREAPETVVFHFTLHLSIIGLLLGFSNGDFRSFPPGLPIGETLVLIAGMASLGALGQLTMSRAYSLSQAPSVAIVAYAGIPVSMTLDIVLWDQPVPMGGLVGGGLMVVAGLILVRWRP